jgi:hypothetical protein
MVNSDEIEAEAAPRGNSPRAAGVIAALGAAP